jgi:hypothetical protein
MEELVEKSCIVIASHLSNPKRIIYLIECLQSLIHQTLPIPVFLSISFKDADIKQATIDALQPFNGKVNIFIREEKTPQMRHFYLLLEHIRDQYDWIMFCDDDDTYDSKRVENLIKSIYSVIQTNNNNKIFAGLYESHCEKDHREHRHEYWCYFINKHIIERFYESIREHPDIIDHKCCDVLFGEFMRRLGINYFFGRLDMRLYNYRVTENQDSVTGVIQSKQGVYTRQSQHPPLGDPTLPDYILDWNDYLYEHLDVYLHDVFLRTIVGCKMDYILQAEFRTDYDLLPYVDDCHTKKMRDFHEYLKEVCNKLYDIPL